MSFNTKNGFNYFEAMSAFQKSIRRCNEDETVFWGIELYESNLESHVWTRVFIIAQEDIGLAEPDMNMRLWSMKKSYDFLKQKRPKRISCRLVYLNMLITLARAKKSRYIDVSYMGYWAKHNEQAKDHQIPDYSFDMHTWKGKKKGRGIEHFYEEGALINNSKDKDGIPHVENEKEMTEKAMEVEEWMTQQEKKKKSESKQKPEDNNNLFN